MSLESVYEILLQGLAGTLPPTALNFIGPEEAYAELKRRTGKDFGCDVEAWRDFVYTLGKQRGTAAASSEVGNTIKNGKNSNVPEATMNDAGMMDAMQ